MTDGGQMVDRENLYTRFRDLCTSYRLVNTARVCLATAACVCISNILQIPLTFESVIGVLVLFSIYPGLIVHKGVERVLGRLVGIVSALVLSGIFFELKLLYVLSMALVLFWGLLRMLEQKTPYASGHAGMTATIMMVVATTSPLEVRDFAYHWWFQVALGVACAMLVARLIPLPTRPALDTGMAGLLADCASLLEAGAVAFERTGCDGVTPEEHESPAFYDLVKLVDFEKTREETGPVPAESYRRLLAHIEVLYVKLSALRDEGQLARTFFSDSELSALPPAIMRALAGVLHDVDRLFTGDAETVRDPGVRQLLDELGAKLDVLRSQPPTGTEEREARRDLAALMARLKDISDEVAQIHDFAREMKSDAGKIRSVEAHLSKSASSGASLFDPQLTKKAFRATVSIMALALGLIYLDLPGGDQVLIAALIVGGQANLGRSLLKWRLRLLGAATGAVYGFGAIVIVSYFPHFPVMLFLLLLGVAIGSYVATGEDRFSYAGLQMALVVPLILVYQAGPPVGLEEAESRFWGALLGGLTAAVVGHLLWPENPVLELRSHLAGMLERCAGSFRRSLGLASSTRVVGTPLADLATIGMSKSSGLLADAWRTWGSSRLGLEGYARIQRIVGDLIADLTVLSRASPEVTTNCGLIDFVDEISGSAGSVAADFDRLSTRLMSHSREGPVPEVGPTRDELRLAVERYRATGRSSARSSDTVATMVLISETIEKICRHLSAIADTLDSIEKFNLSASELTSG